MQMPSASKDIDKPSTSASKDAQQQQQQQQSSKKKNDNDDSAMLDELLGLDNDNNDGADQFVGTNNKDDNDDDNKIALKKTKNVTNDNNDDIDAASAIDDEFGALDGLDFDAIEPTKTTTTTSKPANEKSIESTTSTGGNSTYAQVEYRLF